MFCLYSNFWMWKWGIELQVWAAQVLSTFILCVPHHSAVEPLRIPCKVIDSFKFPWSSDFGTTWVCIMLSFDVHVLDLQSHCCLLPRAGDPKVRCVWSLDRRRIGRIDENLWNLLPDPVWFTTATSRGQNHVEKLDIYRANESTKNSWTSLLQWVWHNLYSMAFPTTRRVCLKRHAWSHVFFHQTSAVCLIIYLCFNKPEKYALNMKMLWPDGHPGSGQCKKRPKSSPYCWRLNLSKTPFKFNEIQFIPHYNHYKILLEFHVFQLWSHLWQSLTH